MVQTILVVDDDSPMVEYIGDLLQENGFEVVKAYNGDEALEIVAKEKPDLVLLDIMMPGMDGKEACRRICAASVIPVIMLSCRAEPENKIECLKSGAEDYIVKPFHGGELIERIKTVLRRNQPEAFHAALNKYILNELEIDFPATGQCRVVRQIGERPDERRGQHRGQDQRRAAADLV